MVGRRIIIQKLWSDNTANGVSLPIELSTSVPFVLIGFIIVFKSSIVYPNKRNRVSKSIFSVGVVLLVYGTFLDAINYHLTDKDVLLLSHP
jgi:uncharacterized membrane protein YczE